MLSFKEFLFERVMSIGFKPEDEHQRETHRQEIHDILRKSYEKVEGGYSGLGSGTEAESKAIHDDISNSQIKAVKREGKISAVNLYKRSHGRKSIAAGTDGSNQGKTDFIKTKIEDNTHRNVWGEYSGALKHILGKLNTPKIAAKDAQRLVNKPMTPDEDGYHYVRKIGGVDRQKIALGRPIESTT